MPYIYSTLATDMSYAVYPPGQVGQDVVYPNATVFINGGTGVIGKLNFITPKGVVTQITDEELGLLQQNEVFKLHVENGFIVIDSKKRNPEKVVESGMNDTDNCAPKTEEWYKKNKPGIKPVVNKKGSADTADYDEDLENDG